MILIDANYLLRAVVRPATVQDESMANDAANLLFLVQRGEAEITTTEAILAEVAFVLASPR